MDKEIETFVFGSYECNPLTASVDQWETVSILLTESSCRTSWLVIGDGDTKWIEFLQNEEFENMKDKFTRLENITSQRTARVSIFASINNIKSLTLRSPTELMLRQEGKLKEKHYHNQGTQDSDLNVFDMMEPDGTIICKRVDPLRGRIPENNINENNSPPTLRHSC
ncbi:hypothetical protein RF11_08167 [Thelohanellus kitauei]|uniref:Uncharacterized protein n=1 Tax=Thelohanellus kitauei TaxID=669202 RepID=A0A0C2NG62_THEKT|nr:hypothetical protein RF11_08167 [Thelohanellus kitauei]